MYRENGSRKIAAKILQHKKSAEVMKQEKGSRNSAAKYFRNNDRRNRQ